MLRSLWISKTGLDAQQSNLDTVSNNLANVSTTAFKRVRPVFEDLMYQNLREPGLMSPNGDPVPVGLQAGNGSHISSTQRIHTAGVFFLIALGLFILKDQQSLLAQIPAANNISAYINLAAWVMLFLFLVIFVL